MRIATTIILLLVTIGNVQAARYVGSVTQPDTVPPGSCCDNTSLVSFVGVNGVPNVIDPASWTWSFDVDFDPLQGITINSMTVRTHSSDFFPDQPNLSLDGVFQFEYPVGLQLSLSPTAIPNTFVTASFEPPLLRVQSTWNNFGAQSAIDGIVTSGIGNYHAFAFDFTNYPTSIGVSCDPGGANICNRADYAPPAESFEGPDFRYAPYYTLGEVRSYMSVTATLFLVPEPATVVLAAFGLLGICCCRLRLAAHSLRLPILR